ncbi:MAG TPA: SIMPL domain-containing protein [Nocardioides sp.]|uniref:SIMPL domain-containing protein n=1 Tax=Nocardioides sp. TaxID=35761 RepID=UPI002BE85D23|nr:SIMPL domain-containing protein [Nocardioides sp.]HTW17774.1 SIMPL domain-containing protein [Nocardioides sp.]
MSETVITVQGSYDAFHPAERATVTVAVGFEGADRGQVVTRTTSGTAALVAGIADRHHPEAGPVTWHATDRLRVWSTRPFHDKGEQRPLVHHAQTKTRAKFRDFEDLARWVEAAAGHPGVSVSGIEWALTEQTKRNVVEGVRARAVEEARRKAQVYADALGLGPVRCVALADPGMLGDHSSAQGGITAAAYSRAGQAEEPGGLSFTPEDIAVSATVDARFLA